MDFSIYPSHQWQSLILYSQYCVASAVLEKKISTLPSLLVLTAGITPIIKLLTTSSCPSGISGMLSTSFSNSSSLFFSSSVIAITLAASEASWKSTIALFYLERQKKKKTTWKWCVVIRGVVKEAYLVIILDLIVLGFNDMSTLEGHFVSSPREREKRDRRESRGDEREGQGRKRNRNESEETEEIKTFPLYPYPLQG